MQYNTEQKKAMESFFRSNPEKTYTAQEIVDSIPHVGKSTIYRLISSLVDEGTLRKAGERGRTALYQYSPEGRCGRHMHLCCSVCGRTEHLDEEVSQEIEKLIEARSGFVALHSTVFECLCADCRKEAR